MKDEQAKLVEAIPIEFYQWLYTIERDVRVWDLTPDEIKGLTAALAAPAPDDRGPCELPDEEWEIAKASAPKPNGPLTPITPAPDGDAFKQARLRAWSEYKGLPDTASMEKEIRFAFMNGFTKGAAFSQKEPK